MDGEGNTQSEKSLYHQSSIDFRCYLEMAFFEPRLQREYKTAMALVEHTP